MGSLNFCRSWGPSLTVKALLSNDLIDRLCYTIKPEMKNDKKYVEWNKQTMLMTMQMLHINNKRLSMNPLKITNGSSIIQIYSYLWQVVLWCYRKWGDTQNYHSFYVTYTWIFPCMIFIKFKANRYYRGRFNLSAWSFSIWNCNIHTVA